MDESEFFAQRGEEFGFPAPLDGGKKVYEFNLSSAQSKLQTGELMSELIAALNGLAESYAGGRPALLFYPNKPADLTIVFKPFESVLNKIYRVNYVDNRSYPEPPSMGGFITADNLFEHPKMNDLLRARLICKYMDGPRYVSSGLKNFCDERSIEFKSYSMNNDRGYYAWHCYMKVPVEMMFAGSVENREVWFELQLTTQLVELITGLTHGLYEGARVAPIQKDWRWQPKSQQFRSSYLGHTLHLLEGIIQTFRDEVLGLETASEEIVSVGAEGDLASIAPGEEAISVAVEEEAASVAPDEQHDTTVSNTAAPTEPPIGESGNGADSGNDNGD